MKYQVIKSFKVKTSQGEMNLQSGQVITLPHDKALKLLTEGKIIPIEKVAYRIYSEILQAYLWVVDTNEDMHSLRASQGITEAIYSHDEIKELRELSKEDLKEIHRIKEVFENSKIEQVIQREDNQR